MGLRRRVIAAGGTGKPTLPVVSGLLADPAARGEAGAWPEAGPWVVGPLPQAAR